MDLFSDMVCFYYLDNYIILRLRPDPIGLWWIRSSLF